MKSGFFIVLSLLVLVSLLIVPLGCKAKPTATPTPVPTAAATKTPAATATAAPTTTTVAPTATATAAPTATPTATTPVKAIVLKYNDMGPPNSLKAIAIKDFGTELEKRTAGRVKFEFYWSEALAKAKSIREAVAAKICETGTWVATYEPAKFPTWLVGDLPLMARDVYSGMMAEYELYKTEPSFKKELNDNGVDLLLPFSTGLIHIYSRMPIATLEDLKGKKMNFIGQQAPLFQSLGAAITGMPSADIYTALERGVMDGGQCYLFTYKDYAWWEVAKNVTLANLGQIMAYGAIINLDTWNQLPADVRQIFEQMRDTWTIEYAKRFTLVDEDIIKEAKARGVTINSFTAAEQAKLMELSKPIWDKWAADADAKGQPGSVVLQKYMAAYSKYEKEVKEKGYPWARK